MWNPALEETLHPFHEFARADANIEVAELKGTNLVPADEIKHYGCTGRLAGQYICASRSHCGPFSHLAAS